MTIFTRAKINQLGLCYFKSKFFPLIVFSLIITSVTSFGQCARSSAYYGEMVPNNGCGVFRAYTNYGPGQYFRMPVLQGGSYSVSTCGAPIDTQLTGYQAFNTTSGTHFFYVDDNGPICSGLQSSVTFVPTFSDYTRVQVSQYNCQSGGSSSITVNVRQNNNLTITSSSASMCAGDTRSLSATPVRVTSGPSNSGNLGSFTGTGVSGTTFTAPTPVGASQNYTITYTFGHCSTTQNIQVYRQPTSSNAGPDQTFGTYVTTSTTLAGNSPTIGTGAWSVISGPGTVTAPSNPNSTITGLVPGTTTTVRWTITNGPCISADQMVINTVNLPVELAEFEAQAVENESVDVSWMTATEQNNDHFLVQRSIDLENWETVDKVEGAGNSTEPIYYRSLDQNPYVGVSYYRLKQFDFNGDISYSGIQSVRIYGGSEISVYPNPTSSDIVVEGNEYEIKELKVYDVYGKELSVERSYSEGKCHLSLSTLPNGMYLIRTRNHLERIVKQ